MHKPGDSMHWKGPEASVLDLSANFNNYSRLAMKFRLHPVATGVHLRFCLPWFGVLTFLSHIHADFLHPCALIVPSVPLLHCRMPKWRLLKFSLLSLSNIQHISKSFRVYLKVSQMQTLPSLFPCTTLAPTGPHLRVKPISKKSMHGHPPVLLIQQIMGQGLAHLTPLSRSRFNHPF